MEARRSRLRQRQSGRSFCPVCDAPLTADMATNGEPQCPSCRAALLPVQVAGVWRRAAAAVVDGAILLFTAGPLAWLLVRWSDAPSLFAGKTALESLLHFFEVDPFAVLRRLAPLLVMAGLYLGLFWHLSGRTPGEKLLRLRVVDLRGRRPSIARTGARVLVALAGALLGGLGWLWVAFDFEKRAWHDHAAGTYVVRDA
jgi:uncharacterized RDD family membrane protein YckC